MLGYFGNAHLASTGRKADRKSRAAPVAAHAIEFLDRATPDWIAADSTSRERLDAIQTEATTITGDLRAIEIEHTDPIRKLALDLHYAINQYTGRLHIIWFVNDLLGHVRNNPTAAQKLADGGLDMMEALAAAHRYQRSTQDIARQLADAIAALPG